MFNLQNKLLKFYSTTIKIAYNFVIIILLLVTAIIIIKTVSEIGYTITEKTVRLGIKELVINILSLIVILELIRAFVEYSEHSQVHIEILIEAIIAFLIREFMIFIFEKKFSGLDIFLWSLGIFFLVFSRGLAILFKPENDLVKELKNFIMKLREKKENLSEN
ncbi:MAG: phosphate-starvation-inducible PsiE family protein [Thermodesulfobacterium sp.]|nr:phosphate-starvation-inducible PsiE family protein [Thermodesulfobacterium sp.]